MVEKEQVLKVSVIKKLEEEVNDLYHFRDYYFEAKDLTNANQKPLDVTEYLNRVLSSFIGMEEEGLKEDRAMYYYLFGKAYNVLVQPDPKAEEMLSKAVKLNPNIVDAWNQLGDIYYKKGSHAQAKHCFENALGKERNKMSLRYLSFFERDMNKNSEDATKRYLAALKLAQEAVDLDPTDGFSWSTLGNSYMVYYFNGNRSNSVLNSAFEAFQRAEECPVSKYAPDMHLNRAVLLQHCNEYKKALEAYAMAMALEPWWETPKNNYDDLIRFLDNTQTSINRKGSFNQKKILSLISELNEKYLGRYANEIKSNNDSVTFKYVPFSELKCGNNPDKVVLGRVVCHIYNNGEAPFTICLVDKEGSCIVVALYNLAQGAGVIIRDFVAIPMPRLLHINFAYNGKVYDYNMLRVELPHHLVVNGKDFKAEYTCGLHASMSQ